MVVANEHQHHVEQQQPPVVEVQVHGKLAN